MVYENIKRIAEAQRYSIAALERATNLGNGAIGKWRTHAPRSPSLKAVADVLGVTVDELLKEE